MALATIVGTARLAWRLAWAGWRYKPRAQTIADRLAAMPRTGLPLEAPVEIRWNEHLVPFIEARSDRDLAVALGVVHAHLRLAQMEMLRRIAQGRLAEVLGPVAVPFDHALRLLDPTRAVPAIEAALPESTREWVEGFVAGINHHVASASERPFEFGLLGVMPESWTVADVLGIARLAAADINWLLWMRLLRLPRGPDWPDVWARLIEDGAAPMPSLGSGRDFSDEAFARLVLGLGRAGSNAVAVSGSRSATGQPWLGGDPHLSVGLPSVWLQAAYRSPSYNVAGLMIPGIPVMAIGRNRWIAWGGTNLHALSSELFDVSDLPVSDISERRVRLAVRWSQPREIVLRDTAYGPVISDAPLFGGRDGRACAFRWVGHQPSDEMSALLAINRARDWAEFRAAANGFAVPGQNLVCADRDGHIGKLRAAWLPRRPAHPPTDIVSPIAAAAHWSELARSAELPAEIDPPSGFIVSANDRPPPSDIPLGWFFSPGDRAERLAALLQQHEAVGLAELAASQRDVAMPFALALRDRLCAADTTPPAAGPVCAALRGWDGRYDVNSRGALAFELVLAHLLTAIVPPDRRALFGAVWHGRRLLAREIDALPAERLRQSVQQAAAARSAFAQFRKWGEAHRLRLAHPLGAIPLLGRRYRFIDWPWPGSSDTVFKSAHGLVTGRHAVTYGSNARYLFDLSDPDGNYLVLLGGQDGHPGSPAFSDQAELFRRGRYVKVPLDPTAARAEFPDVTVLEPARR